MTQTISTSLIPAALATVGGAALIRMIVRRLTAKSKEPAPSKLKVYGFMPLGTDPDCSPACVKLLTFLKMTNTAYEYVPFTDHGYKESPKGKVPWAHGALIGEDPVADSSLIMDALVRSDPDKYELDAHLSKEERAVGTFCKVMLEESIYFAVSNVRWNTKEFERCTIPTYFAFIPAPLRGFIARMAVQKKIVRDLKGQGTGLLDDEEATIKAGKEISALSDFLGAKKYLLGDQISSYDATVYAYVAFIIQGDWDHPIMQITSGRKNVVDYVERMRREFWPELQGSKRS